MRLVEKNLALEGLGTALRVGSDDSDRAKALVAKLVERHGLIPLLDEGAEYGLVKGVIRGSERTEIEGALASLGTYARGRVLYALGDVPAAMEAFELALAGDNPPAEAAYNLGLIYLDFNREDDAIRVFERAVREGAYMPAHKKIYEILMDKRNFGKGGRFDPLLFYLERVKDSSPKVMMDLGDECFLPGVREKAEECYLSVIDSGNEDLRGVALMRLGMVKLEEGKVVEAEAFFKAALRNGCREAELYLKQIECEVGEISAERALSQVESWISRFGESRGDQLSDIVVARLFHKRLKVTGLRALRSRGRWHAIEQAGMIFENLISDYSYVQARVELARLLYETGSCREAISHYESILDHEVAWQIDLMTGDDLFNIGRSVMQLFSEGKIVRGNKLVHLVSAWGRALLEKHSDSRGNLLLVWDQRLRGQAAGDDYVEAARMAGLSTELEWVLGNFSGKGVGGVLGA